MIRFTFYMTLSLAVVIAAVVWFSDRPGAVSIEWQGWLIELSVSRLALAAAIALVVLVFIVELVRSAAKAPKNSGRAPDTLREQGYRALTHGVVAVAAGVPKKPTVRRAGRMYCSTSRR